MRPRESSWDASWERIFQEREWGRYPSEELVRFVARNFYKVPNRNQVRILELGCGPGANLWYLAREGFDVYGIDGSATAIKKAEALLEKEGLNARLELGDVITIDNIYPPNTFDLIVDLACLQCNRFKAIEDIVQRCEVILKPGGKVFSLMHSVESFGYGLGFELEPGTFTDINEPGWKEIGLCHFATHDEIMQLFCSFDDLQIDYTMFSVDNQSTCVKRWMVQGTKTR